VFSVSVAMATYNGSRFIREQLNSIAAQTILPAELVVTDDASSDDTLSIVRQFATTAPFPVHVHPNPIRLGYRGNFMRNVNLCTSEIIALCDQDDVWDARKLEEACRPFSDPEVLLSFHEAWLTNSVGERTGLAKIFPLAERSERLSLFPMINPYGFSMLFRRSLLTFSDLWQQSVDNLEPHNRMAHDQWMFFLASVFGTIAFVDKPLADYRQHENSTYGVHQAAGTFWAKLGRWVDVARTEHANFSVAAHARAAILAEAQGRLGESWQDRARVAAASYRELADHCARRSAAYGSPTATARLNAWLSMVKGGAYNGARWAFGGKTALRDLFCLALPRRLTSVLPVPRRTAAAAAGNRDDVGSARVRP
jgi:hypothetical protein